MNGLPIDCEKSQNTTPNFNEIIFIELTFFAHPLQKTIECCLAFASVRCYFLGFCFFFFLSKFLCAKNVYAKKNGENLCKRNKMPIKRENEWNRLWCMCWTVKQAIMTFVNLVCSGKHDEYLWNVTVFSVFSSLDFDYVALR